MLAALSPSHILFLPHLFWGARPSVLDAFPCKGPSNHSEGLENIPPILSESCLLGFRASLVVTQVRAAPVPLGLWEENPWSAVGGLPPRPVGVASRWAKQGLDGQSPKNKFELTLPHIHIPHTPGGLAVCNHKSECIAWWGLKWASVYILHITFKTRTCFVSLNNLSEREGMSPKVRRMKQNHQDIQNYIAELLYSSSDTQGASSENTKQYYKTKHTSALWTTFGAAHVRIQLYSVKGEVVWWCSYKKYLQWNDFLIWCIELKLCWWTRLSTHYITNWLVENSMAKLYSLILLSLTAWRGVMIKWERLFSFTEVVTEQITWKWGLKQN